MNPEQSPPQTPQPQQPQQVPPQPQPVAYDAYGRPLYAHPPTPPQQPQDAPAGNHQIVQTMRPLDPPKPEVTPEVKARHDESQKHFPTLNLTEGEYVIRSMRRHPIGLFIPMALGIILLTIALTVLINFDAVSLSLGLTGVAADASSIVVPILLFCALIGLGMFVAWYVYTSNKFFLTNESVVQEIQTSLFTRHEQTVSLSNIEDASYEQRGIIQNLFNYGSIRLSTEGDETTYRFTYVSNPKEHIAVLNNAVEAFKLGRPVDPNEAD